MSVHLRPFVVSLRRHNAMCGMALRYWLSTLTRRKPFGSSVPRPANTRRNMFSLNQWLKTPDVDGRYQPIVRDFQAAIPEVLDALPRKYFQQPVSWMTRIFHQFDDVSLMAAQGINSIPPVDSRCLPWAKVTLFSIRLRAQSVVFPRPGRCARRVAVSGLLRTLRLAPLPRSAHDPLPELGPAEAQVVEPERGPVAAAARRAHDPRDAAPRAAPDHAGGGRSTLACAILPVRVGTPLPHIAQHVVETPTVGLLQGNRMGLSATVLGVPGNLVQVSIARCRRSGPARVLPLFLRGKPQPEAGDHRRDPGQERLHVVPAHLLHGAGWSAEVAQVLAHHRFPESLGARRLEHPEAALDRDLMLRALVIPSSFLVIGRAHEELARRNPAQLLGDAANLERRPAPERVASPIRSPLRPDPALPECSVRLDLDRYRGRIRAIRGRGSKQLPDLPDDLGELTVNLPPPQGLQRDLRVGTHLHSGKPVDRLPIAIREEDRYDLHPLLLSPLQELR